MNDEKINCMIKANKFDYDYWDGNRRYGYGGYKYIPGRWRLAADKLIRTYKLQIYHQDFAKSRTNPNILCPLFELVE